MLGEEDAVSRGNMVEGVEKWNKTELRVGETGVIGGVTREVR